MIADQKTVTVPVCSHIERDYMNILKREKL